MKAIRLPLCTLVILLAAVLPAFGAVIWNNGGSNNLNGNAMGDLQQAEDFNLGAAYNITSITFWTLEADQQYAGSFYYALHSNSGGEPGGILSSGALAATRVNQGSFLGLTLWENTLTVSLNNVVAGSYWLALHNGPLANDGFVDLYWAWADLDPTNTGTVRGKENSLNPPIAGWFTTDAEHAFMISGTPVEEPPIPEPGTYALVGMGLAAVLFSRRRK